jgi:cation-transporting P-type ATPase 13A2
MKALMHF